MKSLKLGTKLALGFGCIALIALALGAISYYGATANARNIDGLTGQLMPAQQALLTLQDRADVVKNSVRTLLGVGIDPAIRARQYEIVATAREEISDESRRHRIETEHGSLRARIERFFGLGARAGAGERSGR